MVLWLTQMKKIIVNEFTVPWEERCGATNEIKKEGNIVNSWQSVERKVEKHGTYQWRSFADDLITAHSVKRMFSALGASDEEIQKNDI